MPNFTIRWPGADDADASTDYRIESDETVSGTFSTVATQDATNRGDGQYSPYITTLQETIKAGAKSLKMASGASFGAGNYIVIDREMMQIGSLSGNVASGLVGGIGSTLTELHKGGAKIRLAHESYSANDVTFDGRNVVRFRVIRIQGSEESIAAESVAVSPSAPPDTSFATVWGILTSITGQARQGVTVRLLVNDKTAVLTPTGDNPYGTASGARFHREYVEVQTDDDGYYEFFVPRAAAASRDANLAVIIAPGTDYEDTLTIKSVPDVQSVNVLETL